MSYDDHERVIENIAYTMVHIRGTSQTLPPWPLIISIMTMFNRSFNEIQSKAVDSPVKWI